MSAAKKNETYYKVNKFEATYTPKILAQLVEILQKPSSKAETAKHVLIIETDATIVPVYTDTREEAEYCLRKMRKILRLAFAEQDYRFRIEDK